MTFKCLHFPGDGGTRSAPQPGLLPGHPDSVGTLIRGHLNPWAPQFRGHPDSWAPQFVGTPILWPPQTMGTPINGQPNSWAPRFVGSPIHGAPLCHGQGPPGVGPAGLGPELLVVAESCGCFWRRGWGSTKPQLLTHLPTLDLRWFFVFFCFLSFHKTFQSNKACSLFYELLAAAPFLQPSPGLSGVGALVPAGLGDGGGTRGAASIPWDVPQCSSSGH